MKPAILVTLLLTGCAATPAPAPSPQAVFFERLQALCGKAYEGRLVTNDAADADFRGKRLVMHVRDCSADQVRIPFSVGEDRSRTWVVTRTGSGLRIKHDHRHADGSPDTRTNYGGDTVGPGSATRQAFPVDEESKALFVAEGIPQSTTNIWALDLEPGRLFAYELRRPDRHFKVAFDLSRPVAP